MLASVPVFAIDGLYVGGQLGHIGLTGRVQNFSNALGVGADLGVRINSYLDVMGRFGYSSHSGGRGLTLYHPTFSADFHFYEMNDFDLSVGLGPGFYCFKNGDTKENDFGLNFGLNADVVVDEALRLGIGYRWHSIFGANIGDHFWALTMRVGYFFAF